MVAEGSFDPSTGLHSSTLSSGGDHNLQFMGASCPMGTKDRMTYLKDITLWTTERGTLCLLASLASRGSLLNHAIF